MPINKHGIHILKIYLSAQELRKSPLVSKYLSTEYKILPFCTWFKGEENEVCRSFNQINWFGRSLQSLHGAKQIHYHMYLQSLALFVKQTQMLGQNKREEDSAKSGMT